MTSQDYIFTPDMSENDDKMQLIVQKKDYYKNLVQKH